MWTTRIRRTAVGLLAVGLLAAAGCGDDNGDGGGSGDPGTVSDQEFLGDQLREVPAEGAPSVSLDVQADEHGGWNLHLDTDDFTFAPEQVNQEAVAGEGHAHVYVDDEKFSRVYSEWFFLPASAVPEGEHTLLVTLNANDHTVWAVDGEPITAETTVEGTGMDGHEHDHGGTPGPTASPSPSEVDELIEIDITDGQADPPLGRVTVEQGATVRIAVTSDQPDEIHLHGYDLSAAVGPDSEGVIEFEAGQTGLFELETHESGLVLLQLLVE